MDWIGLERGEERLPRAVFSYSIERENILKGFVLVDTLVEFWRWWVFGSSLRWII